MYPYGLDQLNTYMGAQGADMIYQRYPTRWFIYLTGELDNEFLRTYCEVLFQGFTRVQKHRIFWNYLEYLYGPGIRNRQRLFVVDGVGHSAVQMFSSDIARFFLFDWNPVETNNNDPFALPVREHAPAEPDPGVTLIAHPNPFNEQLRIELSDVSELPLTLQLYDILGREVYRNDLGIVLGVRTVALDASNLASGIYLLAVSGPGGILAGERVVLLR